MAAEENTPERWLPIIGFEGRYEVSDHGRVKSLPRRVKTTRNNQGWFPLRGRIIRPFKHVKGGHLMASISRDGEIVRRMVHHLVLEAFVGLAPEGHECDHIDFNPENNRVENLRWVTHTENIRHTARAGRGSRGESNRKSKLTENDIRSIRLRYIEGFKRADIAATFHVSYDTIWKVATRKTWKHVE